MKTQVPDRIPPRRRARPHRRVRVRAVTPEKASATGPIKVWLSNNPEEIAWGKAMVQEWNSAHPDEKVTAQEIPAGKTSEEVIGAAITAGNAPCLVFNTSPAAVPQFQKQGGLVALDSFSGATDYVEERSGDAAEQYQSPDGKFYQIPWKQNPVMIFYNKDLFKKAGLDPAKPALATYDEFLAASKKIVDSKAAPGRDRAGARQRVLPVLVRLLPAVRRGVRWQADHRGRQGHLRRPGRQGRLELLVADVRRPATPRRRSTTVTPSPTRRRPWRSSVRGPSRSTRTR